MTKVYYTRYFLIDGEDKNNIEHNLGLQLLSMACREWNIEDDISYDAYGKPYLTHNKAYINISHCDGWIVCVISDYIVGIDIECVGFLSDRMENKILCPREIEYVKSQPAEDFSFYQFWTLKEAYLKMKGKGFLMDPHIIEFSIQDEKIVCSQPDVQCFQKQMDVNVILSVCIEGEESILYYESYEKKMACIDRKLFN